jgi:general secretion pathway protein C
VIRRTAVKGLLSSIGPKGLDYNAVLARAMRRQNIARLVRIVQLICWTVLTVALLALIIIPLMDLLTRLNLTRALDSRISSLGAQDAAGSASSLNPAQNWDVLLERKPFGTLGRVAAVAPSKPTPPPSPLMLSLIGTFITQGQEPYAIIEDKKKNTQDMFLLEQSVFEQATLKKIYQDRVEIERNGKLEVLKLDDIGGSGAGVVSSGADDFVIEEAELDKGLENLPLLLTQARAVPYFKDGRSIGLRLFAIKTGSLYEKVGLKNGDILKTINGNNLGDISQALKLFEQLKQERSITLILERDRQDKEFKYTIR